jgi:hypothetical protein
MVDLFNVLINLLLAVAIAMLLNKYLKMKCCPYKLALLIVAIFLTSYHFILTDESMNDTKLFKSMTEGFVVSSTNKDNNRNQVPGLDVPNGTFTASEVDYYGTKMPIMGPLDGLPWDEVVRRVNYLKVKSQYPYRPMKYTDFKTSMDQLVGKDLSGLLKYAKIDTPENRQELGRWYPDNTLLQMNARDCTNYTPGHPLSCVQKMPTLADDGDNEVLLDNVSQKKEKFMSSDVTRDTQKLLEKGIPMPTIFKNAPGTTNMDELVKDISGDMCRGCTVGICTKGVCGSRLIEPGNENILDVDGYVKSFLVDNVAPSAGNTPQPTVNPWTFF